MMMQPISPESAKKILLRLIVFDLQSYTFNVKLLSLNEDGFVSLMDLDSCETKDDLRLVQHHWRSRYLFEYFSNSSLPEGELGDQIKQAYEKDENGILVSVVAACGV